MRAKTRKACWLFYVIVDLSPLWFDGLVFPIDEIVLNVGFFRL